jgi:hypothetical protein
METNKPINIWYSFIPVNVIVGLIALMYLLKGGYESNEFTMFMAVLMGLSLISSAIGILMAKYDIRKKSWKGLCFALIPLIIGGYCFWVVKTCTGKFCGIIEGVVAMAMAGVIVVFGITYTIARIVARKTQ